MSDVYFLIGLPASGKSTYVKKNFNRIGKPNAIILSSDEIREELFKDVNNQSNNELVFQTLKQRAKNAIDINRNIIIDATNITRKSRLSILNYLEEQFGYFYEDNWVHYIIMATPYYKCLENNRKRTRQVPDEVITRMYKQFEFPSLGEFAYTGDIQIIYPFGYDKNFYGRLNPFEDYNSLSHDNPHHRHSVGQHMHFTKMFMKMLTNDKVLIKAAEIHDIGKPFVKEFKEDGTAKFYGHQNVGCYEAMFYGAAEHFTMSEIIELCTLILHHMDYRMYKDEKQRISQLSYLSLQTRMRLKLLNLVDEEAH